MEKENNTGSRKISPVYFVTAIVFAIFLIWYAVMLSLAPRHKMKEYEAQFSPAIQVNDTLKSAITSDSAWLSMMKEKAYLQARTIMAETDSIYLTINLADSTSDIEISGVTVYSAKISSYDISRVLERGNRSIILNMLSQPLTIDSAVATIRKEPLMVKIAPKDTSEYKPDITPDTSLVEPVNFMLQMTNGSRVYVLEEEEDLRGAAFMFDLKIRLHDTWAAWKKIIVMKVPEYHPSLRIRVPRSDSKIIYRALPRNGQLTIYT